jgi:8-oxo-dGTP diphosphatase
MISGYDILHVHLLPDDKISIGDASVHTVPHIHVACAIIEDNNLVLAAQRSERMSLALKWEFPGGKIEAGETAQECLQRELMEEMGITVYIDRQMPPSSHHYATFTITLYPFVCRLDKGEIRLTEHKGVLWIAPGEMLLLDWAEADLPVIAQYLNIKQP